MILEKFRLLRMTVEKLPDLIQKQVNGHLFFRYSKFKKLEKVLKVLKQTFYDFFGLKNLFLNMWFT